MSVPEVPKAVIHHARSFLDLLNRWNRIHALTALDDADLFEELILDSSAILPLIEDLSPAARLVDFGSGMGIPAVVIAAARPDLEVVALDKSRKKTAFIRQVALELGMKNLRPVCGRAEELACLGGQAATAKAVGDLDLLLAWWARHRSLGAPFYAFKGPDGQGCSVPPGWDCSTFPYTLPTRGERVLLRLA